MKTVTLICLSLALSASGVTGESAPKLSSIDDVVVRTLSSKIPDAEGQAEEFLWDAFANKPEESGFSAYRVSSWRTNYPLFSNALVSKAKSLGLEEEALRKILGIIALNADKRGLLPVGAYRAKKGKADVWIVVCKWEYDRPRPKVIKTKDGLKLEDVPEFGMIHICMYAYDISTTALIAYNTCD